MAERKKEEKPTLSCEICMKEIHPEDAETYEVEDYVHHFCGLDCYSKWQRAKPAGKRGKEGA